MKKIVFLCSHPYSGSSALYEAMNYHPKIQGYRLTNQPNTYLNPLNLLDLTRHSHKLSNRSAIYMDELLQNRSFYVRSAYEKCNFVYVIREPEIPINFLVTNEKRRPEFAIREYTFRLRRLCEMAKRTPGAVLLTWNDLVTGSGISLIEDYLRLKEPIPFDPAMLAPYKRTFSSNLIDSKLLAKTQDSYEKYLYYMKSQNIVYVNK